METNTDKKYYVARDEKYGILKLFCGMPVKEGGCTIPPDIYLPVRWRSVGDLNWESMFLEDESGFEGLSFNDEPVEVKIVRA